MAKVSTQGARVDWVIQKGATFIGYLEVYLDAVKTDVSSGYTAWGEIKTAAGGTSLVTLTIANGGIAMGTNTVYRVKYLIDEDATTALDFTTGVYDIFIKRTSDSQVWQLVRGCVSVIDQVAVEA